MAPAQADRWMVSTSHPLAVEAALDVMHAGGNAVDAAVTAAAVLTVVDPRSTGIGGDAFALYWRAGMDRPAGMAAAGPAPAALSVATLRDAGYESMPEDGPWTVTVPGAVAGWHELLEHHGTRDLSASLAPAIDIAEEGFEVTHTVGNDWRDSVEKLKRYPYSAAVYLSGGGAPEVGERMKNPDLAASLRTIRDGGMRAFYEGAIARRIEDTMRRVGGPLRAADLASWSGPAWVSPIAGRFRDVEVFEMPPPSQGIVALQALKLYETAANGSVVDRDHVAIESLKLAFADARAFVTDPDVHPVPVEEMLADGYVAARGALIDMRRAGLAEAGTPGDTVYVAVMKGAEGCSLIQSLYAGFGSGVGVDGTGIVLQNRGAGFVLDEVHPNRPEPGKRPYHTIIPAMLGRDARPWGCLGVVGGFMQPQGHLQVLRNLLERRLDPAAAVAAPRFRVIDGRAVAFEPDYDPEVVAALAERGHETRELSSFEAGGGQLIVRSGAGLLGGSDPRKDGLAKGA